MGSMTVRIDAALCEQVREDADSNRRTLSSMLEYYIELGRSIHRSPDYSHDRVEVALSGGIEVGELSLEEQDSFFAEFAHLMERPGGSHDYWLQRQQEGRGVGLAPDGTLVRQLPGGGTAPL